MIPAEPPLRQVMEERFNRHKVREDKRVAAMLEGLSMSSRQELGLKVGWKPGKDKVFPVPMPVHEKVWTCPHFFFAADCNANQLFPLSL